MDEGLWFSGGWFLVVGMGGGGGDGVLVVVDRETETEGDEGRERKSSFFKYYLML